MGPEQQGPVVEVGPGLVRMREVDSDHSLLMGTAKDMAVAEDTKQEEEEDKLREVEVPLPPSVEVCFVRLLFATGEPMRLIP